MSSLEREREMGCVALTRDGVGVYIYTEGKCMYVAFDINYLFLCVRRNMIGY